MGLERAIDDADLRRLKFLCELHFDSYRPLYEPLKAFLARSPPKYRAQLTSLLQPSESLICDFAAVSGDPQQRLLVSAAYETCLGRFFDAHGSSISRTLLRQIQEDDDHQLFPQYFYKVESPRPLLSLKCLPGDIDSFWEEMLQRASHGAALLSAQMAARSFDTPLSSANASTIPARSLLQGGLHDNLEGPPSAGFLVDGARPSPRRQPAKQKKRGKD